MIIAPVIDGRLQALDAETGKVVWEARVAFPQDHYTLTMAPRIAKGKVIIGVSGGDRPTRGFFDAYDAADRTARVALLYGPRRSVEAVRKRRDEEGGRDLGQGVVEERRRRRGVGRHGLRPGSGARLRRHRQRRAVGRSSSARRRGKDNLYVCSILAVDVDTGELKWHYQVVPGDNWDFDSVQHLILADLTINGRTRKVIMQANKNAFYYVIDRITGQFISAGPFSQVTWAKGIDPKTGRPIVNQEAFYGTDADPDLAGRRRRAQLVADVVQPDDRAHLHSDVDAQHFSYAAEPTFDPRPGRDDRHRAAGADADAAAAAGDRTASRSKDRAGAARWSRGIRWRSRCGGACPAAAASAAAR